MSSVKQTGESKKSRRPGTITHAPTAHDKNVYRIRYTLPAEKNGKQKRVAETVKGTKKDAEKMLRKRLTEIDAKRHVDKTKSTVADFVQEWLETRIADNKITTNTSNDDLHIAASGTGNVVVGAIRINGTEISTDDSTQVTVRDGLTVTGAVVMMSSLPTSDPSNAGQLWNSSGDLKISAG